MKKSGMSHFICHGYYRGTPHRWIETVKGSKIDAAQRYTLDDNYLCDWKQFVMANKFWEK